MMPEPLPIKGVDEHVLDALRSLIVGGKLEPGTPLRLAELSQRFGVSTMPVRAALARLEAERLVRHLPRRGTVVAPLELEDLEEIQAVRSGIEALAARLGAERVSDGDLARMNTILRRVRGLAEKRKPDPFLTQQWEMHDICYRAAKRPQLLRLVHDYRRRSERYIRVAIGSALGFEESLEHQERFVAACQERSGPLAESRIRDALAWVTNRLSQQFADQDT